jgi:hypothetical protein
MGVNWIYTIHGRSEVSEPMQVRAGARNGEEDEVIGRPPRIRRGFRGPADEA